MSGLNDLLAAIKIGAKTTPRKGEHKVRAVFFDTYGTVCDFYGPIKRRFERFAREHGVTCDAGAMAIAWRTAYALSTFRPRSRPHFVPCAKYSARILRL